MAHGTAQAIFGLGDENDTNSMANLAVSNAELTTHEADTSSAHVAAGVDITDSAGYTSNTTVETALAEIYSRLPYTIDQASDMSVTTNTTLAASTLVAPVLASTLYAVEAFLVLTGTANSGYKFGISGPAGATCVWHSIIFDAADSTLLSGENAIGDSEGATAALTVAPVLVKGLLTVAGTAGNFSVTFAQNASHADASVLHAESWLRLTKVQ